MQLDEHAIEKLGRVELRPIAIARNESEDDDIAPESSCQGVLAIRQDLQSPALIQLVFDDDLKAAFVM
jgi:hypothetical protein